MHRRLRCLGGTAIVALIIVGMGSIGMTALISLVHARGMQIEASQEGFLRRIRELNGRQLAKEYVYHQVMPNSSGAGETIELSFDDGDSDPSDDNWARIVVSSWNTSAFSATALGLANPVGPGAASNPFEAPVTITVLGNVTSSGAFDTAKQPEAFQFRVCGKNPALTGTVLGVHRSATGSNEVRSVGNVNESIKARGAAYVWESASPTGNAYNFEAERAGTSNPESGGADYKISGLDVSGSSDLLAPANAPYTPLINSFGSGVANDGTLSVIWGAGPNSLQTTATNGGAMIADPLVVSSSNGVSSDGAGAIFIDLNDPSLPHVLVAEGANAIKLIGQADATQEVAASTMSPVIIAIKDSTNPAAIIPDPDVAIIECAGNNTRPLIVGIVKDLPEPMVLQFAGTRWRMIFFAEETITTVDTLGLDVTLEGGVFTNRDFIHNDSGSLQIVKEDDPGPLESIAPRWVWVESYRQP